MSVKPNATIPECCDALNRGLVELAECAKRGDSHIGSILDVMAEHIDHIRGASKRITEVTLP